MYFLYTSANKLAQHQKDLTYVFPDLLRDGVLMIIYHNIKFESVFLNSKAV